MEAFFSGHAFDPHRHDSYAIGLTFAGVQSFDYRGRRADSLPGRAIVLHPDERHDGRAGAEGGFRYRMLYLDPRLIAEALGEGAALPFVREPVCGDRRLVAALTPALADLDRPPEELEADQFVQPIAEALQALSDCPASQASPVACRIAVGRAKDYLDAHFSRVVGSAELSEVAGVDRFALARHFRTLTGTSPYRYLTMRRLDHARALLKGGLGIAEVAADCGFADQSHMTRQFKAAYGLTPGRWLALSRH